MISIFNHSKLISTFTFALLLSACGSGNSSKTSSDSSSSTNSVSSLSSESASSSSATANQPVSATLIYPGNFSNTGSVATTFLTVELDSSEIESVEYNSIAFSLIGANVWRSDSPLALEVNSRQIEITLNAKDSNNAEVNIAPVFINNTEAPIAGSSTIQTAVDDLVFSEDGNSLYFTEPSLGSVAELNLKTGDVKKLYQADRDVTNINVHWPISAVTNGIFYWVEHLASYDKEETQANIGSYDIASSRLSNTMLSGDNTALSIIVDAAGQLSPSQSEPKAYLFDETSEAAFKQVDISQQDLGTVKVLPIEQGMDAGLEPEKERIELISTQSATMFLAFRNEPTPSIITISSTIDAIFGDVVTTSEKRTELTSMDLAVSEIDAVTASPLEDDVFYIADGARIWKLKIASGLPELTLVSSSSLIPFSRGQGPNLRSGVTSIAHHPKAAVVYIARGSFGITAVDLETGDRSTLIN